MTLTLTCVLLPLVVAAMATTAAPLAEQTAREEVAVAANGDSDTADRAKRAKEEIVFGNQQNSARVEAAKKFVEPLDSAQSQEDALVAQLDLPSDQQDNVDESGSMAAAEGQPGDQAEDTQGSQGNELDQLNSVEPLGVSDQEPQTASDQSDSTVPEEPQEPQEPQQTAVQQQDSGEPQEEAENALPVPEEGGEKVTDEEEQPTVNNELPLLPVEEGAMEAASEDNNGKPEEDNQPQQSRDTTSENAQQSVVNQQPVADTDNAPNAESEEALQALDHPQDIGEDDVESLLKDLHEDNAIQVEGSENGGDAEGQTGEREEGDEGSAERELMQMTSQMADGNVGGGDYSQSLLKYILSHGDEYGHIAGHDYMYQPTDPYFLERRRRSSAGKHPLLHIHRRRHNTEKELSRSKRTKRDLFDDDLYYNPNQSYDPREEEEEEEEEEKDEELQELIAYLMALYPDIYNNEPQTSQFPAYLWAGPNYPEEEPYWEEPSPYEEEAPAEWGEPDLSAPALEPSFYPEEELEEEEEPGYYPVPAKRQEPGERRKRYFFPFAREPYTHWGAFVPAQKRADYEAEDPYRRLKELAMVLADERQPSYFDALDDYKRK